MKRCELPEIPRAAGALGHPIDKIALGIGIVACIWFQAVALWGVDAPATTGHFMSSFSVGIAADNILKWRTLYPVLHYITHPPNPSNYYINHPFGGYWATAFFMKIFGHHTWVVRFVPALFSGLSCVFLYKIGRAAWGPIEGACSALGFGVLPITLGFAIFNNLEVPVMWGAIFSSWAYLRLMQTSKRRYLWWGVFGLAFTLHQDWEGLVWGATFLAFALVRAVLAPNLFPGTFRLRPVFMWWSLCVSVACATVCFYVYMIHHAGLLPQLFSAYSTRSSGNDQPLANVLKERAAWIDMSFLPIGVALGKLALPIVLFRAVLFRTDGEFIPIPFFVMALFQYVIFKNGADVHVFWPQPFGIYFALGIGALAATGRDVLAVVFRWWSNPKKSHLLDGIILGGFVIVLGAMGVSAVPLLKYCRSTSGEMTSPRGQRSESQAKNMIAAEWFASRFPLDTSFSFHPSFLHWYHSEWTLYGRNLIPMQPITAPDSPASPYYVLDASVVHVSELERLAARHAVHVIDNLWFVDGREPPGPAQGYIFEEHSPSFWEWFFKEGGIEPMRTIRPDAWQAWEQRMLLHQAAEPPSEAPVTLEQFRIQHNIAVSGGAKEDADRLFKRFVERLDQSPRQTYERGTELLGVKIIEGPRIRAHLYFRIGQRLGNQTFSVHSMVIAGPRWSLAAIDPLMSAISGPFRAQSSRWIEGHIYPLEIELSKRPGEERFFGSFTSLDGSHPPRCLTSAEPVILFELK